MNKNKVPYIIFFIAVFFFLSFKGVGHVQDDPGATGPRVYASHSVLASGEWYKFAVAESGICRLNYADLQSMGINVDVIDPRNIRIYGNGGGMLPESNAAKRYDDLRENAIAIVGEGDGRFDPSDYILFYASGPVTWAYNNSHQIWESTQNLYSDSAYYFLTASLGNGKRIQKETSLQDAATDHINSYDFRTFHEKDAENLIKSGRAWFGEEFDITLNYSFSFPVPGLVPGSEIHLKTTAAARSTSDSYFNCSAGNENWNISLFPISTYYNSPYASGATDYKALTNQSSPVVLKIQYYKSTSTAVGWLDAINLTARCALNFSGGQLDFRDVNSLGDGRIAEYTVANAAAQAAIWDITDPLNCHIVQASVSGNDLVFTLPSDSLREFVAFDNSKFVSAYFISKLKNQDLHATSNADLVIIAPPIFYDQAVRLAAYHTNADDLNTIVITPELIYNEFSSGSPDVSAIRDFIKMLYDRGGADHKPKYLLLFGDGSYDNKNRLPNNTNFIPTWQTSESFDPVRSGVSDDYFGILDDNEGQSNSDKVDIGIGRLPVATAAEAEAMVDKIIHYSENSINVMGDWRNVITFIADDEDGNEHVQQADSMAGYIKDNFGDFNVDKIYMDAYPQQATTSGARYPEVNLAITQRVEKGCLILNYTGHGGETGWAHEQVLEVQDINGWTNNDKMPVFVTATCEFSRFDDPSRTSAGELVFLNPKGGGVALFTTTRPTYGNPNFDLNRSFYKYALTSTAGSKPRMGDIIRDAKRENGSDENGRKFVLLGDPAQRIAYPQLNVATTSIRGHIPDSSPDTLMALAEVSISGMITDQSGNLVSDFQGLVYPTVFDKTVVQKTLGNDGGTPFQFNLQKSILYKGKVQVINGLFTFTFIVPKDIAYRFDYGKISYYASNGTTDASGYYSNLIIGGSDGNLQSDVTGPEISLFINDEHFTDGSITDENPWLVAKVLDVNGINTIGSGIGHDITAILDGRTDEPFILNDFYEADVDTYRSGTIRFPFARLTTGEHMITVKVWDIYDNSSEATIHFVVHNSEEFVIERSRNYPNPFNAETNLVFDHNQQGNDIQVKVDIYSMTGQLVYSHDQTSRETGTVSTPVSWDGRDESGSRVNPGMYFYTITAETSTGLQARSTGKMICTR
jgi:hypothetical protein